MNDQQTTYQFLTHCHVIPVLVIDKISQAVPLARALLAGGLSTIEVTLRTDCALDAIAAIRSAVSDVHVGAGTILNSKQLGDARSAGAEFFVSPGAHDSLLRQCADCGLELLPGAVTATEIMQVVGYGFTHVKFFPAATSGGAAAIKALTGPFQDVTFVPTGGVNSDNLTTYLSLDNVAAVGGSWMLRQCDIANERWDAVQQAAKISALTAAAAKRGDK